MEIYEKRYQTKAWGLKVNVRDDGSSTLLFSHFVGGGGVTSMIFLEDLPDLLIVHRMLGHAIEAVQPGVISPIPDGDPDEVDAMKVIHEADFRSKK